MNISLILLQLMKLTFTQLDKKRHIHSKKVNVLLVLHARIQNGGRGFAPPPPRPLLKNHKVVGFQMNTGRGPLENHKAIHPAFRVGPSSARQRNAKMAFRWRSDGGPIFCILVWSFLSPVYKKREKNVGPRP